MARPVKEAGGLLFFSVDIDINDDPKLEFIESKYGLVGFGLYIKLLIRIYKAGYFIPWTEREAIIFAKKVGLSFGELDMLIIDLVDEGLFSKILYEKYRVLTSRRIQRQFITALVRRTMIVMHTELNLIDEHDELIKSKKVFFKPLNTDIINNSKIKKIDGIDRNPPDDLVVGDNNQAKTGVIVNNNLVNVDNNSHGVIVNINSEGVDPSSSRYELLSTLTPDEVIVNINPINVNNNPLSGGVIVNNNSTKNYCEQKGGLL